MYQPDSVAYEAETRTIYCANRTPFTPTPAPCLRLIENGQYITHDGNVGLDFSTKGKGTGAGSSTSSFGAVMAVVLLAALAVLYVACSGVGKKVDL